MSTSSQGPSLADVIVDLNTRGLAFQAQGRLEEACALFARAVELAPQISALVSNYGAMLCQLGRQDAAVAQLHRALVLAPDDVFVSVNLGTALLALKRFAEAEAVSRKVQPLAPAEADLLNNLGCALSGLGANAEALDWLVKAQAAAPVDVKIMINLAHVLNTLGRNDEALAWCQKALSAAPNMPEGLNIYGNILRDLGRDAEARDVFRMGLSLLPQSLDLQINYVTTLYRSGLTDEAVGFCRRALQAEPDCAALLNVLATSLKRQDGIAEATVLLERAVAIEPDAVVYRLNLGNLYMESGRVDLAEDAYARVVALAPGNAEAQWRYAECHRFRAGDPQIAVLETALAATETTDQVSRMKLSFALGKAYDEVGQFDQAFAQFTQACRLKRERTPYDEAEVFSFFDRMRAMVGKACLARFSRMGTGSDRSVFIVGMPRSGTTLIEQILASHPQMTGIGEQPFFQEALDALGREPEAGLAAADAPQWLADLGQGYTDRAAALGGGAARIVDKLHYNFIFAGLIHLALPQARIIHVRRDPLDTCLSCYSKLFLGEQAFLYDQAELGRYYRRYGAMMEQWRAVLPRSAFLEVDYEAVVADLPGQARRLIEFTGLDWDAACLDFHATKRLVATASAAQVRRPLYTSSIGRSRHYLAHLGPLIEALVGSR